MLEALAWTGLDAIDLAPSGALFEVVYAALSGAAMSAMQFAVIRLVLGNRSSAARAWIPVSTALEAGGAVVLALWFRGQTGATLPAFVAFAVTTVVQGLLLAEIFGRRSTFFLWLMAMALFSAGAFVVPVMAIYNAIAGFNTVVAVIAVDALSGLFYGAVGGAFLVWPAVRTKAPEPAARSLPEPTP